MRVLSMILLVCALQVGGNAQAQRQRIGQVLGKPVYADQISGQDAREQADSLQELFMQPILRAWYVQHAVEIRLTEPEARMLEQQFKAYAECSKNGYVLPQDPKWRNLTLNMYGGTAKAAKLLYDQYGGGRLLFQQGGTEAFDAMRRLLEQRESEGAFAITDPQARALAYDYWTRDHGAMFITDPAAIHRALRVESVIARCPGA